MHGTIRNLRNAEAGRCEGMDLSAPYAIYAMRRWAKPGQGAAGAGGMRGSDDEATRAIRKSAVYARGFQSD